MTVLVAARLPQGILISADSRGTIANDSGDVIHIEDDMQKVFAIDRFIIGIVGNAYCGYAIVSYVARYFSKHWNETDGLAPLQRIHLFEQLCFTAYQSVSNELAKMPILHLVVGSTDEYAFSHENTIDLKRVARNISSLTSALKDSGNIASVLRVIYFPARQCRTINVGEYILLGSGRKFEELSHDFSVSAHRSLSQGTIDQELDSLNKKGKGYLIDHIPKDDIGEIWSSISARISMFFHRNNDDTFNMLLHGFVIQHDANIFARTFEFGTLAFPGGAPIFTSRMQENTADFLNNAGDGAVITIPCALIAAFISKKWSNHLGIDAEYAKKGLELMKIIEGGSTKINYVGMTHYDGSFLVLDFPSQKVFPLVGPSITHSLLAEMSL